MNDRNIKLVKILDFMDTKMMELRKDESLGFWARITAYNLLIDLQEFIKEQMEEETEERNGTGLYC